MQNIHFDVDKYTYENSIKNVKYYIAGGFSLRAKKPNIWALTNGLLFFAILWTENTSHVSFFCTSCTYYAYPQLMYLFLFNMIKFTNDSVKAMQRNNIFHTNKDSADCWI